VVTEGYFVNVIVKVNWKVPLSASFDVSAERIGLVRVLAVGESITVTIPTVTGPGGVGVIKWVLGPHTQFNESGVPLGRRSLVIS